MLTDTKNLYQFGPFELDPAERLLVFNRRAVPVTPKAFDMLVFLVERSGHLCQKDELMKALWPDSFVEEGNLSVTVSSLRKVLGDDRGQQRYIETVSKRGYRFAAAVNHVIQEDQAEAPLEARPKKQAIAARMELLTEKQALLNSNFPGPLVWRLATLAAIVVIAIVFMARIVRVKGGITPQPVGNPKVQSLAVLPFQTVGEKTGDEYVGIAMADALITKLGNSGKIVIRPTSAIQKYAGAPRDVKASGVEQGVDAVLDGRIQREGDRVRVTVQLTRVRDGVQLWAGGRNLAAEYFTGLHGAKPWRDLSFDLQGPVATAAASQFEADWVAAGGRPAAPAGVSPGVDTSAPQRGGGRAQFLPSGPDQAEDTVHALLIDACFHVRERLLIVTPYFVPDTGLETAMRLAARRGVKIDLCIPAVSNHRLADFARNRALRALGTAGVSIHLLPYMNHGKAVVFDESLAISGSVNLDSRSLLLNYECAVVFYGAREIDWLANWIQDLIPEAQPFDGRPPGLWRDIGEGLLLTVAYQL